MFEDHRFIGKMTASVKKSREIGESLVSQAVIAKPMAMKIAIVLIFIS